MIFRRFATLPAFLLGGIVLFACGDDPLGTDDPRMEGDHRAESANPSAANSLVDHVGRSLAMTVHIGAAAAFSYDLIDEANDGGGDRINYSAFHVFNAFTGCKVTVGSSQRMRNNLRQDLPGAREVMKATKRAGEGKTTQFAWRQTHGFSRS